MIDLNKWRKLAHCGDKVESYVPVPGAELLELIDQLEAAQKDAATMRSALEDIASGEITREHCQGPHCVEELGIATADELSSRAAGALSFIDAAMPPNTSEV